MLGSKRLYAIRVRRPWYHRWVDSIGRLPTIFFTVIGAAVVLAIPATVVWFVVRERRDVLHSALAHWCVWDNAKSIED